MDGSWVTTSDCSFIWSQSTASEAVGVDATADPNSLAQLIRPIQVRTIFSKVASEPPHTVEEPQDQDT